MKDSKGITAIVVLAAMATSAAAQSGLDAKLKKLNDAAQADPALSADFKSALADVAGELGKSGGGVGAWASKLKCYGDFRLRHESDFRLDDSESRNRERLRLRVGADYAVNDQMSVGARLVTGSATDENSPHQNLGATFDKMAVNLDRAFLTWKPTFVADTWINAGKFGHAFEKNPVYGELVWDEDVQPTGLAAGGTYGAFKWVAGEYLLLDNSTSGTLESAAAFVAQVSTSHKLSDTNKLTGAFAFYRYNRLNPDDVDGSRLFAENAGNATTDTTGDAVADDYLSRFTIYNPFVAFEHTGMSQPLIFAAEYVLNPRAKIDGDSGYSLGVKWGKNKAKGDCQYYYSYQVMEQDAVLSNFTNDDFLFGTNYRGHLVGMKWQCLEQAELHVSLSAMRRDDLGTTATTDDDQLQCRARADFNFRF
ncbi:MAG: hypothetical protein EXS13_04490 [Planctomycetes bacterium]|nr:hypothetical protein [Planctomycetota bacterium]